MNIWGSKSDETYLLKEDFHTWR